MERLTAFGLSDSQILSLIDQHVQIDWNKIEIIAYSQFSHVCHDCRKRLESAYGCHGCEKTFCDDCYTLLEKKKTPLCKGCVEHKKK